MLSQKRNVLRCGTVAARLASSSYCSARGNADRLMASVKTNSERTGLEMSDETVASIVRPMRRSDAPELLNMMRALVAFERGQDFRLDEAELLRRGFGDNPEFGVFVAEVSGSLAGFAAYYEIPFMHSLKPLLMMKWLFVKPEYRSAKIGEKLLQRMSDHARSTGHEKFCWFVLKDNVRAQKFYRSHGANPDPDWDRWEMMT